MGNERFARIFLIVMDSVGIGAAPDAERFNDLGADTLGHIAESFHGGLKLPNMQKLGLGSIRSLQGIGEAARPLAHFGRMQEASNGKDTMTGHWELMGLRIDQPFRTFPEGFPQELIGSLEAAIGRQVIGNKPASGTEILDELGAEHCLTGKPIVYTSADSVLQIAAHEEVIPLAELYRICGIARNLTLQEQFRVGRVIARPFLGKPGSWTRTTNRHDYALKPTGRTVLDDLKVSGLDCIALGKINDIFDGEGITQSFRTISNMDGMDKLLMTLGMNFRGICFLNLVDFDANFGHRRNPQGYGKALEQFDARLPEVFAELRDQDLLILTADHGNDPVHHGTDHTREFVPLLVYYKGLVRGCDLGVRATFADLGCTIADNFHVRLPVNGMSFLNEL